MHCPAPTCKSKQFVHSHTVLRRAPRQHKSKYIGLKHWLVWFSPTAPTYLFHPLCYKCTCHRAQEGLELWWRKILDLTGRSCRKTESQFIPLTDGLLSQRGWGQLLIELEGWYSEHTRGLKLVRAKHSQGKRNATCSNLFTYSMMRSFEAFGISANSWQLRTLNPYPSQTWPLISADLIVIGSKPVFSTLKVLLRVKFGSLTFVSETNEWMSHDNGRVSFRHSELSQQNLKRLNTSRMD